MERTAAKIAQLLGGEVQGNPEVKVNKLGKIESAKPGALTFLANGKYEKFIYSSEASVAIVSKDWIPAEEMPAELTLIRVDDAYSSFAVLLAAYNEEVKRKAEVHPSAIIHESAQIGEGSHIGAGVVIDAGAQIGDRTEILATAYVGRMVKIGSDCQIFPGARILDDCELGDFCTVQANTVIGSDGFGFAPKVDGSYSKVPQTGNVIIEDNCDIGAGCTIDRATLGSTIIKKGCKLDNLIQIAHNVVVGEKTVIAAQTGIAGSTVIGERCMFGGQVGLVGHIKIADGTKFAAKAGVTRRNMKPETTVQGNPAVEIKDYQKFQIALRKLVRDFNK